MSAVLERRNADGVLLRYYPDARLHVEQKDQPTDLERIELLKAECACLTIRIIGENVLSDLAMRRLLEELDTIQQALNSKRRRFGMCATAEETA